MQNYDIKRGYFKDIDGGKLEALMKGLFDQVRKEGDALVAKHGALEELRVRIASKSSMEVSANMRTDVDNATAADTIKRYNDFLLAATGFTSKERKKRLNAKLKKGTL